MLWGDRGEIFPETVYHASQTFWKEISFDLILHLNCLFLEILDSHGRVSTLISFLLEVTNCCLTDKFQRFRKTSFCFFRLEKWSVYGPQDYFCREVYDSLSDKICSLRRSQMAANSINNNISLSGTEEKTFSSCLYWKGVMLWGGPSRINFRTINNTN